MTVIDEICADLSSIVSSNECRDDIINRCARDRLLNIYTQENEEFDNMINKIEENINYNNYNGVKRCVSRLLKLMTSNRKTLLNTLERLM